MEGHFLYISPVNQRISEKVRIRNRKSKELWISKKQMPRRIGPVTRDARLAAKSAAANDSTGM